MDTELNNLTANFVQVQREAIRRTNEAVDIINSKLNIKLPYPTVRFSLRGGTAGKAWYRENLIEYSPTLLGENVEDFLRQTVRHEVAHLGARMKFGPEIKPHGKEWASCCWYLSIPAVRCHNYELENVPTRATSMRRTSPVHRTENGLVVIGNGARITRFED